MAHRLTNLNTERASAGHSIARLAQLATTSEWLLMMLEEGGTCTGDEAQRIADALGISLETLGKIDLDGY